MTEILVIRHGQRADEAPQSLEYSEWYQAGAMESEDYRWFDPPLTASGRLQGRQAGRQLASMIDSGTITPALGQTSAPSSFPSGLTVVLFTSPLLRTLQTAEEIAAEIPGAAIKIVPGLCQCAAAVMKYGLDNLDVLTEDKVAETMPGLPLLRTGMDPSTLPQTYMEAMDWLVAQGPGQYVVVSHREGINDMFCGRRLATPYCCFARFEVLDKQRFELISLEANDGAAIPAVPATPSKQMVKKSRIPTKGVSKQRLGTKAPTGIRKPRSTSRPKLRSNNAEDDLIHEVEKKLTFEETNQNEQRRPLLRSRPERKMKYEDNEQHEKTRRHSTSRNRNRPSIEGSQENEKRRHSITKTRKPTRMAKSVQRRTPTQRTRGILRQVRGWSTVGCFDLLPMNETVKVLSFLRICELANICCTSKILQTRGSDDSLWRDSWGLLKQRTAAKAAQGTVHPADSHVDWDIEQGFKIAIKTVLQRRNIYRVRKVFRKMDQVHRRCGVVNGCRQAMESKSCMGVEFSVHLNNQPAKLVDSVGKREQKWVARSNLISTPVSEGGIRRFALSSTFKISLPLQTKIEDVTSLGVFVASKTLGRTATLISFPAFSKLDWRSHLFGPSDDGALNLFAFPIDSSTNTKFLQGMMVIGVWRNGQQVKPSDEFGFITFHLPHEMVTNIFLELALPQPPVAAPPPIIHVGVSVRTLGVPLFETKRMELEAVERSNQFIVFEAKGCAGDPTRELHTSPKLSYRANAMSGQLSDVFIMDLSVWNVDNKILWSISRVLKLMHSKDDPEDNFYDFEAEETPLSRKCATALIAGVGNATIEICTVSASGVDGDGTFVDYKNQETDQNMIITVVRKLQVLFDKKFFSSCFG